MDAFAVAPPGIGAVTQAELKALGVAKTRLVEGGVEFSGGWPEIFRANLLLRSASRVLVRIAKFPAVSFPELARKLKKIAWEEWLAPGIPVEPQISSSKSKLYHTGKIAGVLLEALDRPGAECDGGGRGVYLRLSRDEVVVSVDTSGELLHRRGYRRLAGVAPIRENLAAACLLALGYDGSEPLLDPCCGSGTFPVEAALIATGTPPGINREFAFSQLPSFDGRLWGLVRAEALDKVKKAKAPIYGSDSDPGALRLAVAAATAAGVADLVSVAVADIGELETPAPAGLLVANPPYGLRLGGGAYRRLRNQLSGEFSDWRWGVIECQRRGAGSLGLAGEELLDFSSGGLRLRLLAGKPD